MVTINVQYVYVYLDCFVSPRLEFIFQINSLASFSDAAALMLYMPTISN